MRMRARSKLYYRIKKKCLELGLDSNNPKMPKNIMSELELGKKRDAYDEILEVVKFFSNKMIKLLEGTPVLITITDEDGYLLDVLEINLLVKQCLNLELNQVYNFEKRKWVQM